MAGRHRDAHLDEAIVRGARLLLHTHGYRAFGMAELANHLGIARTTIYDRWPTRMALLDHVLAGLVSVSDTLPPEGDLHARLTDMLTQDIELARTPQGRAIAQVLLSDQDIEGEAARALRARLEIRRQLYRELLYSECSQRDDVDRGVDLALSLVWGRAVLLGSLPHPNAEEFATTILTMLRGMAD